MNTFLRKNWKNGLAILVIFIASIATSAYQALKISNDYIRNSDPPPMFSIRFVLYPNKYIEGMPELGCKPGWVVIYAPRSRTYGTAFSVSPLGSMLGSGMPRIVFERLQQGRQEIEKFQKEFAKLDAAVQTGMSLSESLAVLGRPVGILTNNDGTLDIYFNYEPRALEYAHVDWLTNGFSLQISNSVVVRKGYSFTSNH